LRFSGTSINYKMKQTRRRTRPPRARVGNQTRLRRSAGGPSQLPVYGERVES
jgi:hypothetical protein